MPFPIDDSRLEVEGKGGERPKGHRIRRSSCRNTEQHADQVCTCPCPEALLSVSVFATACPGRQTALYPISAQDTGKSGSPPPWFGSATPTAPGNPSSPAGRTAIRSRTLEFSHAPRVVHHCGKSGSPARQHKSKSTLIVTGQRRNFGPNHLEYTTTKLRVPDLFGRIIKQMFLIRAESKMSRTN